jgi:DNA polymerase I
MKDRILLVDGTNNFVRCWAVNPTMTDNGDHVGGVVGFIKSLKHVMREVRPTLVVVAWDGKGGSQKRRGVYAEYKSGRKPRTNRKIDFDSVEESKMNLDMQHAKIRQYLELLGVLQVELEAIEADDVLAFLAHHFYARKDKVIVSTDRDFLQLVDAHTLVYSPTKKVYYTMAQMKEEVGILAENYIYMKIINGDGSDNIKGIRGLGPKTVLKLFPFLSERKSNLDEIMAYAGDHVEENPRYKTILDSRDLLVSNMGLMQLTEPVIGPQSVSAIRYAVERKPTFVPTEFRLSLIRDGIQMTDNDLFTAFNEYRIRYEASQRA